MGRQRRRAAPIRDGIARNAYPNETAVRTQIVQRILHELGWNVFDPDQVYNEYPLKLGRTSRRIDLALCVKDRKPRCIVELKSTDYDLKEIGRSDGDRQLFEYAFHAGAPLALLTNGVNWRLYSTHSAGTYAERLVRTLDIEAEPLDEVAAALDRSISPSRTRHPEGRPITHAWISTNASIATRPRKPFREPGRGSSKTAPTDDWRRCCSTPPHHSWTARPQSRMWRTICGTSSRMIGHHPAHGSERGRLRRRRWHQW